MSRGVHSATKTIGAANTFSDSIRLTDGGKFDVSLINSSFSGTITLQRKRPNDSTWRDISTYTAGAEEMQEAAGIWDIRIGCKTGAYTSGSMVVEVSI